MSTFHTALVDRVHFADIEPTKWAACKNVLRAIANHANEEEGDLAWPSNELLVLETGASESVITRTTTLLHKRGWIIKKRRHDKSNLYRINVRKLREHQVDRGHVNAVYMREHVAEMAFPGEASQQPKRTKPSRKKAPDQGSRQIDDTLPSNRPQGAVKSTTPSGQIDDLTINQPSGNHQPTNEHVETPRDGWMDGTHKDPSARAGAQLLAELGVRGKPVEQWATMLTTALDLLGEKAVRTKLTSHGAGPGAIVKTRLPGLAAELQAKSAAKNDTGSEARRRVDTLAARRDDSGAREADLILGTHDWTEPPRGDMDSATYLLEVLPAAAAEFVEARRDALIAALSNRPGRAA